ncbi:MAG TPA: hypothetical protein VNV43_02095 [Candidatus Acidoferrales bacterium]|nr:hypothetical protein [Candidatus Acidoferrales bacterium]
MNGAIVISETGESTAARNIRRLLEFFGVSARVQDPAQCRKLILSDSDDGKNFKLFGSAANVLQLLRDMKDAKGQSVWSRRVHSIFVCNDGAPEMADALIKQIAKDEKAEVQRSTSTEIRVNGSREFCGVMSGLGCSIRGASGGTYVLKSESMEEIVSSTDGAVFAKLLHDNVPIFFSTAGVIYIDSELGARDFNIRDHFLPATPIVMYIKWAFAETCFQPAETGACLIIDDPPLKPRYGFVEFERLSEMTERHHFTGSLAFIPWNWRRSDSRVVRLFKKNSGRLSLSVHGCDHTRGEFGTKNGELLRWKVLCAAQRMKRHDFKTGLRHDPVMVFPQGIFSKTAMQALKGSEFIGVVNSEVISADPKACPIKISDFWSVGLMNYESFPIFTRRDPWQGVENFAFDILLGKPCIAVVHHNDCHDNCRHVVEFIDSLNRLNIHLEWRDLGTVVRRSFRQRKLSSNAAEIEMFGKEILLENPGEETKYFCVRKRESSPEQIKEVRSEIKSIEWTHTPDGISFGITLKPHERQIIQILFHEFSADAVAGENSFAGADVIYWMKTTFRRYLCEIRDNYVMGKTFSHSHV